MPPFSPPAGYIPVPSALDGIKLWGPAPEAEVEKTTGAALCAACGGAVAYDPKRGAAVCTACGTVAVQARRVGYVKGRDFTLEAMQQGRHGWGESRRILHCETCGADLHIDGKALTTSCPFCASHQVGLVEADPNVLSPEILIPFTVTPDRLPEPVKAFLGSGWMHPFSLADLVKVGRFTGLYVPHWFFDADYRAAWEGEIGHDRTETYTDSQGRSHTRTVTHWTWKSGSVSRSVRALLVPGTTRVSERLLQRLYARLDLSKLAEYDPSLLAGFQAQGYDVALPEAWTTGKAAVRERARIACQADAGGDHQRNFSVSADLDDEKWKYGLLPIWLSSYVYEGKTYQVMVCGQSGLVVGQKPVVWWRIYLLCACFFMPGAFLFVLGIPLLLVLPLGITTLIFAVIALLFAYAGARWAFGRANDAEAA